MVKRCFNKDIFTGSIPVLSTSLYLIMQFFRDLSKLIAILASSSSKFSKIKKVKVFIQDHINAFNESVNKGDLKKIFIHYHHGFILPENFSNTLKQLPRAIQQNVSLFWHKLLFFQYLHVISKHKLVNIFLSLLESTVNYMKSKIELRGSTLIIVNVFGTKISKIRTTAVMFKDFYNGNSFAIYITIHMLYILQNENKCPFFRLLPIAKRFIFGDRPLSQKENEFFNRIISFFIEGFCFFAQKNKNIEFFYDFPKKEGGNKTYYFQVKNMKSLVNFPLFESYDFPHMVAPEQGIVVKDFEGAFIYVQKDFNVWTGEEEMAPIEIESKSGKLLLCQSSKLPCAFDYCKQIGVVFQVEVIINVLNDVIKPINKKLKSLTIKKNWDSTDVLFVQSCFKINLGTNLSKKQTDILITKYNIFCENPTSLDSATSASNYRKTTSFTDVVRFTNNTALFFIYSICYRGRFYIKSFFNPQDLLISRYTLSFENSKPIAIGSLNICISFLENMSSIHCPKQNVSINLDKKIQLVLKFIEDIKSKTTKVSHLIILENFKFCIKNKIEPVVQLDAVASFFQVLAALINDTSIMEQANLGTQVFFDINQYNANIHSPLTSKLFKHALILNIQQLDPNSVHLSMTKEKKVTKAAKQAIITSLDKFNSTNPQVDSFFTELNNKISLDLKEKKSFQVKTKNKVLVIKKIEITQNSIPVAVRQTFFKQVVKHSPKKYSKSVSHNIFEKDKDRQIHIRAYYPVIDKSKSVKSNSISDKDFLNSVYPNIIQFFESELIVNTVTICKKENIQVIPIHDSFSIHISDVNKVHKMYNKAVWDLLQINPLKINKTVSKDMKDAVLNSKHNIKFDF